MGAYWVDIAAVAFFVVEWLVYGITLEHTAYGRDSLSARMNRYREVWVRNMLDREARMADIPRRITNSRDAAEAAFKKATTKPLAEPALKAPSIPGAREQVSLRIDRDVLDHFQEGGPGWQERINDS
mgnify:CR=1 FL=1